MIDPPPAGPARSDGPVPSDWIHSWTDAPAGLADLDENGVIVTANAEFRAVTGLSLDDVATAVRWTDLLSVGSRVFYETQIAAVLHLQGSVSEVMVDVLARDGTSLPALFGARSLRDGSGRIYGIRVALTAARDRRRFETALLEARSAAEEATAGSTRAQRRLQLQASATVALASSTDPVTAMGRLADVLVPTLADWCLIFTGDPDAPGTPMRWAATHAGAQGQPAVERIAELLPVHATASAFFARSLAGAPPTLIAAVSPQHLDAATDSVELRELFDVVGTASAIVASSYARGHRVANLVLVRGSSRPPFTEEDRDDVAEVSARTGIVIDNTRRYAREHADSMILQQSLLTVPPAIAELEIAVRYLPAQDEVEVGGDWYDAYLRSDGVAAVAIGDVAGHNIAAAAAMGQLRGIIRTIGYTTCGMPSDTLSQADEAARGLRTAALASAILARIDLHTVDPSSPCPDAATVTWSNAGHLPPLLLTPAGEVTILERPADLLLGVDPGRPRHDHSVTICPGDTFLLYTDGLVERAGEHLDEGIARLAAVAAQHHASLSAMCDRVIRDIGTAHDDVALLAIRLRQPGSPGDPDRHAAAGTA